MAMPAVRAEAAGDRRRRSRSLSAVPAVSDAIRHYAQCRTLGHSWQHKGQVTDKAAPLGVFGAVGFRSVCPDCGTERIKWLTRSGALGPMRYEHPDDYTLDQEEKLDREGWRKALIVTVFGE